MEKEALISNLKTKVGENDFSVLSERTVDNLVEQFLPMFAEDDKVTDETYALPVSLLKSYVGQYRHDVKDGINKGVLEGKTTWESEHKTAQEKAIAEAVAKAKEEWEKSTKEPPKKEPEEDSKKTATIDEKISDAIKNTLGELTGENGAIGKLTKQFGDYMAAQQAKEKAAVVAKTRADLTDFLIELGADERRPRVIELALADLEIGDKPVMSDLQKQAKARYEALYKDLYGDGGKPFAGGAGSGEGGGGNEALASYLKEREKTEKAAAESAAALKQFLS